MPTESTMTDEGISLVDEHNMRSADRFWVLRLFLLGNVVSATRHTQRIVHRVVETFLFVVFTAVRHGNVSSEFCQDFQTK